MPPIVHPIAPVYDEHSRVLILGTFPSVKSREEGFYYGNSRNRFWQVISSILGEPLPGDISRKRCLLLEHRCALWDVIRECELNGSSDASIRAAVPNDLERILRGAPIERILLNGSTAGRLYMKHFGHRALPAFILPSTSPANAGWSEEKLVRAWRPHLPR